MDRIKKLSGDDLLSYFRRNKEYFHKQFGVIRMGVFGSFVRGDQTASSDIDIVVEMEESKKSIHTFLQFKRFLEEETERKIDLGFERALKPAIREKIKGQIIYV